MLMQREQSNTVWTSFGVQLQCPCLCWPLPVAALLLPLLPLVVTSVLLPAVLVLTEAGPCWMVSIVMLKTE
jgi:hypothetical protein